MCGSNGSKYQVGTNGNQIIIQCLTNYIHNIGVSSGEHMNIITAQLWQSYMQLWQYIVVCIFCMKISLTLH